MVRPPSSSSTSQGDASAAARSYEVETNDVLVRATPVFIEEESSPALGKYLWAYHIEIENRGTRTLQLMTRHWRITDREGRVQHVDGPGVIGQQPVLGPGERFEYTSGCPLSAPSGMMQGTYDLTDEDGAMVVAQIPLFALDSPYDQRRAN
ncbi:MAG TPA: Co2+/Mg2+ efflux protein ApaG [Hyphomonadaceae bacterium]|nr:Co2+/Mg2+ efflux protein ApaG [Hyphomonadaceae bacterium]